MAAPARTDLLACDVSDFCNELADGQDTQYSRTYGPDRPDRVLESDAEFALVADLSPLTIGHCLFLPRAHHASFGSVARDAAPALEARLTQVMQRYTSAFGELAIIEHGSSSDVSASACVVHAHLHFLPVAIDSIVLVMRRDGIDLVPSARWADMTEASNNDRSYYMVSSLAETYFCAAPLPRLPRHYARIAAARALGLDNELADWAIPTDPAWLMRTVQQWKGTLTT